MAAKETKTARQKQEERIFHKRESAWLTTTEKERRAIFAFAEEYKKFLAIGKTERLCVTAILQRLHDHGFTEISKAKKLTPGQKIYKNIKDKCVIAAVVGTNRESLRLVGSHIDSPRLDLKPWPLYEDSEVALLQSHYYGGIKKYHWVNVPLALHGVAITTAGKKVVISIGEKEEEPKFIIPDLLPHLTAEQMKRDGRQVIKGEELNIICGHIPVKDKKIKEKIKFTVLDYLHREYGLIEEDFSVAELELVPAGRPMDIGFDRGLVGAYGQDDRICAYTSLAALLETSKPHDTAIALFVDKEETGSNGDTGAESLLLFNFAMAYWHLIGKPSHPATMLEQALSISADVTTAMDPTFKDVNDPQNVSFLGRGVSIEKYGGGGGKYSTNDARAEYMAYLRGVAQRHKIPWQTGEAGKVDVGGGGTIAKVLSRYGMDCVDAGPCMLGMHATCEVTSKLDLYSAFRFYRAFFNDDQRV